MAIENEGWLIIEYRGQIKPGSTKPTKGAPPSREQQIRGLLANDPTICYLSARNHVEGLTMKEFLAAGGVLPRQPGGEGAADLLRGQQIGLRLGGMRAGDRPHTAAYPGGAGAAV
jgi:hypothetical protein